MKDTPMFMTTRSMAVFVVVEYSRRSCLGFGAHLDGHVGDGEEIIKLDAKCFVQLFLVLGLQCRLSTREKRCQNKTLCLKKRWPTQTLIA